MAARWLRGTKVNVAPNFPIRTASDELKYMTSAVRSTAIHKDGVAFRMSTGCLTRRSRSRSRSRASKLQTSVQQSFHCV